MIIPKRLNEILIKNPLFNSIVSDVIVSFQPILEDNKLYFFEEYTDHGIKHIESVLNSCDFLIPDDSIKNLNSNEVACLILSVILHDLGMHIEYATFKSLISGEYDDAINKTIDTKTWKELWDEFLIEAKRFNSIQRKNIFGSDSTIIEIPNLNNKDALNGIDKKLIGEFIRRYHGRFAYEVAIKGLYGNSNILNFGTDKLDLVHRRLAGLIARSHSMNIRGCFESLVEIGHDSWRNPHGINVIYLMALLRIADYIQIDSNRVNTHLLKVKTFSSPFSSKEHSTHLAIQSLNFNQPDAECIYAICSPKNSEEFVKIDNLLKGLQYELDSSWAILGETYGFIPNNKPALKFRRIKSNLTDAQYLKTLNYVPKKISFEVDNNLSKLLVSPLYGDSPTYGVRELLQNAIDSCLERKEIEKTKGNNNYIPKIIVSIDRLSEDLSEFKIVDNGKGMSEFEIINYFLSVGNSFRKSLTWKKNFTDEDGKSKVNRNGKFGIGVLAAFLLGSEICVKSKSIFEKNTYNFKTSIDSDYIDLVKSDNNSDSIGVQLSIPIDNKKRNKLLSLVDDENTDVDAIQWNEWYLYDEPKITFIVDNSKLSVIKLTNISEYNEFSTINFEKIFWKYEVSYSSYGYANNKNLLACNGIIISKEYKPNKFITKGKEHIIENDWLHSNKLIHEKPSLIIQDKEGIFPLRLDRNGMDCKELPFEDKLLEEVSKELIIKILNIELNTHLKQQRISAHNPTILYSHRGYTINSEYFINGLSSSHILTRVIIDDHHLLMPSDNLLEKRLLYIVFKQKINLTYQEWNVFPRGGGKIILSTEKFKALFKSDKKRLPKYIKDGINVEYEDENYTIYTTKEFKPQESILDKSFIELNKTFLDNIESFQEVNCDYFKVIESEITSKLFKKYFKNNYIIPYSMDERKEMYPEAFKDLKMFMK